MGSVATSFMVFTCYAGWWYQRLIRKRFILTVEDIYRCVNDENTSGTEMDNMGPSEDHSADAPLLSVIGDGAPLEEADHEESPFVASTLVKFMAPTSAATAFHIARMPVGEIHNKIETLGSE
jgi:hypothetical protein